MQRLRKLFSVTAVRLTVLYSLLFGATALGLIFYVTAGTVTLLKQQVTVSINDELKEFAEIYEEAGLNGAISALELRSRAPGANLYIVSNPSGEILAGNVLNLEAGVLNNIGWTYHPFSYTRFDTSKSAEYRALARVVELPNGMRLLIGRDIGEPEKFRNLIFNSLALALGSMVTLGFLAWFFVGRRVLKRIDLVARSTDRIMSGDREERLPISGSGDEFDRLSVRLNSMLDRINLLDEGLKQVSDNIAHDLKTPLTRIRNSVEASLAKESKTAGHRQALENVLLESENLIKTFNALLMISQVESGSSTAQMAQQNISEITADIVELYEPAAEEQNFQLRARIEDDLKVNGNRELLSQMISNLIDNALKYGKSTTSDSSLIEVEARSLKGRVVITVADHGSGIPDNENGKVLQRFYRLEQSRNLPGSGLGLALVSAIAKMHFASLALKDNDPGLKVVIEFPV
ncbi:MAG: HAMP domain-containing histidine kinase [Hyphomicrobiales bacterium]|nr:HAMP domain-containing histidine kinase [Hyphomicrobiales bacterium]